MALHFVLGSPGSGKSHYLYEMILKETKESPAQLFFLVVPEQFTLQAQRELVQRQKNHGIMNIDVVSFARLAYRVFDELGLVRMQVLEETGKNLVLRRVAQEQEGKLQILKGSIKKSGYINEVKSVLSELAQYRIGPEELEELIADGSLPAPFRYRLMDLSVMYQGMQEFLAGNFITAEEVLEVLGREAGNSSLLKGSVLVLDGFTGFTPVQYEVLARLMHHVRDIYVAVTLDGREDPYLDTGMQDLFYLSKKTIRTLSRIAGQEGITVEEPIRLAHGQQSRYGCSPQLEWLEQNLFRSHIRPYREAVRDIALYQLPGPREELTFLAAEIRRLVQEEGYRYQDMAIVCGDVQMYGNYVPEIFDAYEIPYFLDQKRNVSYHAFTEMIRAALELLESDFAPERVMAYLRCGFGGISMEELDLLENYLLANRIRGSHAWQENWVRLAGLSGMEELAAVNQVREKVLAPFLGTADILKKRTATVREKTIALYHLLTALSAQQQMEERRVLLEQQGKLALAREYEQMYRLVMDLLDKLAALLPQEVMSIREYRQMLEAGFAASAVGIIPPGYDSVLIGDTIRTRLPEIQILFLAGVNDGMIPRVEKQGGLLSEQERGYFAKHGLELAPGAREQSFIQKFYLYIGLTKPSRRLYLTWCRTNGEGREIRRSYLTGVVQSLFPALTPVGLYEPWEWMRPATIKSGKQLLVEGFSRARGGSFAPGFLALLSWYRGREDCCHGVEELLEAAFYRYQQGWLGREVARELYGKALLSSVTRLEQQAACAYAHFISYGIGVKERELGEFAPVDMGSLFHEALERYAGKLEEGGYHWTDVPGELQERLVEESMTEAAAKVGFLLFQDARTAYSVSRMTRILKRTVETISRQIADSSFRPEGYEVSFDFVDNLKAVNFHLSQEERLRLRGRIDRMDIREQGNQIYVKVIDYKSGSQQFQLVSLYHGLQLQLVVYLNAAAEILKRTHPKAEVIPAGMYYYHLDDPVIEVRGQMEEAEIQEKIYEELKLQGAGTDEADNSVSKSSQALTREELLLLSDFASQKIKSLGTEIYEGRIAASPYVLKDKCACDYCPYHGICGFDPGVEGYAYRKLEHETDREVILERMKEEVANGNDIYPGTAAGH